LKKARVAKHIAATKREGSTLFLVEGDCIEENTNVFVLGKGNVPIKSVEVGDDVLSHTNSFRTVVSKAFALKDGVKLNGAIYSPDHRLYVYDTATDSFVFKKVGDINKGTDKLVKNRLIEAGIETGLHVVESIKGQVVKTDRTAMRFSDTHDILYVDDKGIKAVTLNELKVGDYIIL
jgi:hypothetical protein